jgi:hypothetical protein
MRLKQKTTINKNRIPVLLLLPQTPGVRLARWLLRGNEKRKERRLHNVIERNGSITKYYCPSSFLPFAPFHRLLYTKSQQTKAPGAGKKLINKMLQYFHSPDWWKKLSQQ